jgi:hypothetical protein
MTVNEAIRRSETLFPADFDSETAYLYLSEIESKISCVLFGGQEITLGEADGEHQLIACGVYSQLYPLYIVMKRELSYGDADRYAFYSSVFEQAYAEYERYVSRKRELGKATQIKNF